MTEKKRVAKKVSPDEYEKNQEYYDHLAVHNRRRILENASAQGRRF